MTVQKQNEIPIQYKSDKNHTINNKILGIKDKHTHTVKIIIILYFLISFEQIQKDLNGNSVTGLKHKSHFLAHTPKYYY